MCGICGYLCFDGTSRPSESVLKAMMDTLVLRGPDDHGAYLKESVALGHRRLSIIDLKTGRQPMSTEDGSLTIVYNGEVYNFPELKSDLVKKGRRFRTDSDTEVVLRCYEEYGEDCVKHFNGMFSLAIWDARDKKLFLARDRFGKKPLYYAVFDRQFIFASELKAVLKHPSARRRIDPVAVSKYLAYEYVPSPHSIFKDIKKLEPGFRMRVKNGVVDTQRYWDLKFDIDRHFDPAEGKGRLLTLLKESVRKRLVSDVPLGVFLSGGIDSSAVVAMMAELMDPKSIKTFSIGFKERSFDESADARAVASHFGTDHREQILDPRVMLDVFPNICDILDEPFADSSIIPTYLVSAFTRKHVTVALGGDGGDELFLGYPSFIAHRLDSITGFIPARLKRASLKLAMKCIPASNEYMSLNFKARRFLRGLDFDESMRHQAWIGSITPAEQKRLFAENSGGCGNAAVYDGTVSFFNNAKGLDPLDRASYIYIKTYMTDDILTKVDRASMANSLEVRAPFLDNDLARFAATVPAAFKMRGFSTKWILKTALEGRLPRSILNKKKQGFAVPVAQWLKEDLRPMLLGAFEKGKIEREGIFDHRSVNALINEFLANKSDTRKEIWTLFMFEMWYDKWCR
jgi:asparagine synthase (glutamine-hydrolysing)